MSDDKLEFQGIVLDSNKGEFTVGIETEAGKEMNINARLAGKLRLHDIRVIVGDVVLVEVSAYDLTRGRITKRFKRGDL